MSVSAACWAIHLPVPGEPVSETMSTSACVTIAAPAGSPWPPITLSTPGGRMSAAISANLKVESGVFSAGLRTEVQPAANAGPIFHMAIISG